jgi:glucose/arabinose dehydrogenase
VLEENTHKTRLVPYASGLRNPVGFDWDPQSGVMYAGNNGPDHQGFELPPEYFSRIETGSFHGMPWYQFNGQTIRRDSCIRRQAPKPVTTVSRPCSHVSSSIMVNAGHGLSVLPSGRMGICISPATVASTVCFVCAG